MTRLVVIGGDAGGMSGASHAKRRDPTLDVVAFERGAYTSYSACGIPYFVADVVPDAEQLIARSPDEHRRRGIEVHLGHEVTAIDVPARRVTVRADGRERDEPFDHLLIGTGALPLRPPIDGIDAAGIFGVQTLEDGLAVKRFIDERAPASAVVVGAGYIGLEMAEALVAQGIRTCVVEMAEQPMTTVDPDMGDMIADAMREVGIELFLGERVTGFESIDGVLRAVVTEARTLPADLVVLGLGVQPNSELAAAAGVDIGETGGVVTDERMETAVAGVWAAGDCVETRHRITGRPVAIALGTHANKQGRVAGTNITGGDARFGGVVGTAITKVCAVEIGRTGLGHDEAREAGFDPVSEIIGSSSRSGYYPGAAPMKVKIVVDRPSARILGAQIVGRQDAGKRIDVFATALWNEMDVHDFAGMDLSYAPPFSPVWDPVLIAARKVSEQLRG